MYASIFLVCFFGVAAAIWAARAYENRRTVRIERNILCVGKDELPIAAITRVDIAPMYDVAPADDLWIFVGAGKTNISFFNRAPGAGAALRVLEASLQGLDLDHALSTAREESVFEQPVNVWSAS
jgi:hypothetical protein